MSLSYLYRWWAIPGTGSGSHLTRHQSQPGSCSQNVSLSVRRCPNSFDGALVKLVNGSAIAWQYREDAGDEHAESVHEVAQELLG
jgi:hypothetical protein